MELIVVLALLFLASPFILLALYATTKQEQRRLRTTMDGLRRDLGELDELRDRVARLEARLGVAEAESPVPVVAPLAQAPQVSPTPPVSQAESDIFTCNADLPPEVDPAEPVTPMAAEPAQPKVPVKPPAQPKPRAPLKRPAKPAAAGRVVMPAAKKARAPWTSAGSPKSWARRAFGDADWEAVVGGNWLNKLGAVVLVVGIALLLAYSVSYLGPVGRVALGLSLSVAMLGAGVVLHRRERYRIFAEGLLGGGWAGLYFTTYAMHGLAAARVIDSPLLGTLLLFAVAVGMLGHSLHYRSQAITGLAFSSPSRPSPSARCPVSR